MMIWCIRRVDKFVLFIRVVSMSFEVYVENVFFVNSMSGCRVEILDGVCFGV